MLAFELASIFYGKDFFHVFPAFDTRFFGLCFGVNVPVKDLCVEGCVHGAGQASSKNFALVEAPFFLLFPVKRNGNNYFNGAE